MLAHPCHNMHHRNACPAMIMATSTPAGQVLELTASTAWLVLTRPLPPPAEKMPHPKSAT